MFLCLLDVGWRGDAGGARGGVRAPAPGARRSRGGVRAHRKGAPVRDGAQERQGTRVGGRDEERQGATGMLGPRTDCPFLPVLARHAGVRRAIKAERDDLKADVRAAQVGPSLSSPG